jgi:hypothetical protein
MEDNMAKEEWEVSISFPYTDPLQMVLLTDEVCTIVGKDFVDAGTLVGSNIRDVTWSFDTKEAAEAAADKLMAADYDPVVYREDE